MVVLVVVGMLLKVILEALVVEGQDKMVEVVVLEQLVKVLQVVIGLPMELVVEVVVLEKQVTQMVVDKEEMVYLHLLQVLL